MGELGFLLPTTLLLNKTRAFSSKHVILFVLLKFIRLTLSPFGKKTQFSVVSLDTPLFKRNPGISTFCSCGIRRSISALKAILDFKKTSLQMTLGRLQKKTTGVPCKNGVYYVKHNKW